MTYLVEKPSQVETMFVTAYKPAWASVGVVLEEKIYDPIEALVAASANWGTYKLRAYTEIEVEPGEFVTFEYPDVYGNFRDSDHHYLGKVGPYFVDIPNVEAFNWFKPFLEDKKAYIETAGVLRRGEIVWILAKIEGIDSEVVSGDKIEQFLLLTISHNSKKSDRVIFLNVRTNSASTLGSSINNAQAANRFYSIRHTKNSKERMTEVQAKIELAKKVFDEDIIAYRELAKRPMDLESFKAFLAKLYKEPLAATVETDTGARVPKYTVDSYKPTAQMIYNFMFSKDLQMPGVKGTRWAAYNAIAEYVNHQSIESRRNGRSGINKLELNLEALWFTDGAKRLSEALELLLN
jgi:phage/plasmid-like protein (TIGR03299 family)